MKRIARWIVVMLAALAVVTGLIVTLRPQPVAVDAAFVTLAPMIVSVDEEGMTRIGERYVISSPLHGRLRRITLDPGDAIEAGVTPVATIEPMDPAMLDPRAIAQTEARVEAAAAAVRRAESLRERARAAWDLAETEHGRIASAGERDAATTRELARAKAELRSTHEAFRAAEFDEDIARYELDVARSSLLYARGETPEGNLARMLLTSPIDGVVLRVLRESISVVDAGEPLLEVGDLDDLELVIDVLSTDGVRIDAGDRVMIEHWGGDEPLAAVVRLVEPSAFTHISALGIEEQRVNVIADFVSPLPDRTGLGDQYRVEAKIIIWHHEAVLGVPTTAVFRTDDRWAVYVIRNGRAFLRQVQIGQQNDEVTQILAGLDVDQLVVRHSTDNLVDGTRIRIRRP
ncbi:MAG: HlyD family efflux transporter periplasmic adaptor subunit [Phycisphaera sp.]|nr:MAG: HlyD family efflux transporter periplasmic adaptor subunit [Phycisphaera sp.]